MSSTKLASLFPGHTIIVLEFLGGFRATFQMQNKLFMPNYSFRKPKLEGGVSEVAVKWPVGEVLICSLCGWYAATVSSML